MSYSRFKRLPGGVRNPLEGRLHAATLAHGAHRPRTRARIPAARQQRRRRCAPSHPCSTRYAKPPGTTRIGRLGTRRRERVFPRGIRDASLLASCASRIIAVRSPPATPAALRSPRGARTSGSAVLAAVVSHSGARPVCRRLLRALTQRYHHARNRFRKYIAHIPYIPASAWDLRTHQRCPKELNDARTFPPHERSGPHKARSECMPEGHTNRVLVHLNRFGTGRRLAHERG